MTHIKGTTRAQTVFLRAFVKHPGGPPADQWPSPVILRRWLKRPGFCGAMNSILRTLRYQADFHLTAAAASGAYVLHGTVSGGDVEQLRKKIEALTQLLRMSHIRHRFADPLPEPSRRPDDWLVQWLKHLPPTKTIEEALLFLDQVTAEKRPIGQPGLGHRMWKRTGHPFSPRWQEKNVWDRRINPRPPRAKPAGDDVDPLRDRDNRHFLNDDDDDDDDARDEDAGHEFDDGDGAEDDGNDR